MITQDVEASQHAGDRLAIAELLFRYADRLDRKEPDGAASCFLPEGILEIGGEEVAGRNALSAWLGTNIRQAFVAIAAEAAVQTRVVSNVMVRFSGDRAHAESIMTETTVRHPETTVGSVVRCVRHNDELVRTDDGWLFARRQQLPQWSEEGPRRHSGVQFVTLQDAPEVRPKESLGRDIWKTLEVHRRRSIAKLAQHGIDDLSAPHLHLLSACAPEALRPIELARRNQMSPQALNHLLTSMERRGYLCRSHDSDHPRRRFVRLTSKGRQALDIAVAAALEVEAEIEEEVGAEAFDGFQRVLAAFTKKWNA